MAQEISCGSIVERFLCQRIRVTLLVEGLSLAGRTVSSIARHKHSQGPYRFSVGLTPIASAPDGPRKIKILFKWWEQRKADQATVTLM